MSAEQTPTVEKKIEEIPSDDEEAPGLEPVENPELAQGGNKRQNRGEKKIRKHLAKTGLTQVTGVTKMAVRKGGQVRTKEDMANANEMDAILALPTIHRVHNCWF
jgi:hypothetical protein